MRTPTLFLAAVLITAPIPYAASAQDVASPAPSFERQQAPAATPEPQENERQPAPARAPRPPQERTPQAEKEREIVVQVPAGRPMPTRNVKVDVTITDQAGSPAAVRKVVSLIVADGRTGSVRTQGPVAGNPPLSLNVDADVHVTGENKVLLQLRFLYMSQLEGAGRSQIQEDVHVLLVPGTPLTISQSADPSSDRRVTVEVKAEILK